MVHLNLLKNGSPFFDISGNHLQIKVITQNTAMDNSNSLRIHESVFSYYYHIWFLPVNMDILNISLCVNKKLQKALTSGNLEQVFLRGND